MPAPPAKVSIDGAHIFFRCHYFNPHDRFEQDRLGLLHCILKCERASDNKCALIRINLVEATIDQAHFYVDHVVPGKITALHGVMNALFSRLDELARNCSALDLVFENESLTWRWLDLQFDVRVLPTTARLLLENLFTGRCLRNRLPVSNLRLADIRLDAELAFHTIDDDFQMQLAHAGDNRLSGFMISRNIERRIFLRQTTERNAQLVLIGARLGFDGHANNWRGKINRFEN